MAASGRHLRQQSEPAYHYIEVQCVRERSAQGRSAQSLGSRANDVAPCPHVAMLHVCPRDANHALVIGCARRKDMLDLLQQSRGTLKLSMKAIPQGTMVLSCLILCG